MLLGWVLLSLGAQPLAFEEVLLRVRENSAALKAARANAAVAEAEVERAWVGWQPKIDAIGTVAFNSAEQKFELPGIETKILQPHVELTGTAAISQTLFNISVLRAPAAAKAARAAAIARADAIEDEILFEAATLYATLAGLRAEEAAAARAIAVAEHRVKDAQTGQAAGTASRLHFIRAETDRVRAVGQRSSLAARRAGVQASLIAMIGEEVEIADQRIASLGATQKEAARKIVVARERDLAAAEKQIGLTNLSWLPTLTAQGAALYTNEPGFSPDHWTARATINLALPIYDGGLRYAETHAAEARALAAKHELEQTERDVRAYLDDARAQQDGAKAELEQAEAELALANETVQQTEDLLKAGLATNLELTDADARRFSADRALAEKQLAFDLARLRVHYANGGSLIEPRSRLD